MDVTLRNCKIVTPNGVVEGDLGINDGVIYSIGSASPGRFEYDCKGALVMPGAVDIHVHFRDPGWPHKEDLSSGSAAAIIAGITTVCDMPNTQPSTTTLEALKDKIERARGRCYTDIGFYMGMTPGNISELMAVKEQGLLLGVKAFFGSTTEGFLVTPEEALNVMQRLSAFYLFHGELQSILKRKSPATRITHHSKSRSEEAAIEGLKRVIELANETGRPCHYLHISAKGEIKVLRGHKPANLTVGVTPNHLSFSLSHFERLGQTMKVNPPIRDESHRRELLLALKDGLFDNIETDHAPHLMEEKLLPFKQAPAGIPGVDTLVPAAFTLAQELSIDPVTLAALLSSNPARIIGMKDRGQIREGLKADLYVIDPNQKQVFAQSNVRSKAQWSPFTGTELVKKPSVVILNGRVMVLHGSLTDEPIGEVINTKALRAE